MIKNGSGAVPQRTERSEGRCGKHSYQGRGPYLTRAACPLIADAKAPLFDKDLASSINTHFDEVLKQMEKMTDDTVSDSDQD